MLPHVRLLLQDAVLILWDVQKHVPPIMNRLEPQTGTAFELRAGQLLRITDLEGEQVADLIVFNLSDKAEWLSSGRSIDYANRIYLTKGDILYSNRSRPMFT